VINVRDKGQRGEREFLGLLSELLELTEVLTRNLSQTREGGADCIELPGYSIEIKNCATVTLNQWWKQAIRQALNTNSIPVLAYKVPRKGWIVVVPAAWVIHPSWLHENLYPDVEDTMSMSLNRWVEIYKSKTWLKQWSTNS